MNFILLFCFQDLVPITEEVSVPFDYHRFIIGQKGRDVRQLMTDFEVNIAIPPPTDNSDLVKVSGPPQNVARAKQALLDDEEREDRVSIIEKKFRKLHYINPKGKFILSPQEQRQGISV